MESCSVLKEMPVLYPPPPLVGPWSGAMGHRPCPLHNQAGHRGWVKAHDVRIRAEVLRGKIPSLQTLDHLTSFPANLVEPWSGIQLLPSLSRHLTRYPLRRLALK